MILDPDKPPPGKLRYAVVGLGYFAQAAVLPAFAHATDRAELVALVSGDAAKRDELAPRYGARFTYSYDDYGECLKNPEVDAVYLALPNSMHAEFAVRAARAGVHVLCEKPMALEERDCARMIREAAKAKVKLMVAYRLHFERANLEAIRRIEEGAIGQVRIFESVFSQQVREPNIRLDPQLGGGPLYDMGIYSVNAARYLFRSEPTEVFAFTARGDGPRFSGVNEMLCGLLRFPGECLATFVCSFGAYGVSSYRVVGTAGALRVEPAFGFDDAHKHTLEAGGKLEEREFPRTDQVAAEIAYFADCVRTGKDPEPSGAEGLADVRVIRALERSATTGRRVRLAPFEPPVRPTLEQVQDRPAAESPELLHARAPSGP
jgi:glucose-fructose oxidoreductase